MLDIVEFDLFLESIGETRESYDFRVSKKQRKKDNYIPLPVKYVNDEWKKEYASWKKTEDLKYRKIKYSYSCNVSERDRYIDSCDWAKSKKK